MDVVCLGVGTTLVYSPTVSSLGRYFEKRRALANGIGAAGAGVGGFVVPPLLTVILQEYSIFGTLLIMAALMLNIAVCGALIRPLNFYAKKKVKTNKSRNKDNNGKDNLAYNPAQIEANIETSMNIVVTKTKPVEANIDKNRDDMHTAMKYDWKVIKTPIVIVYRMSALFLFSGLPVVLMFLPAFGISVGLSDQDASLLLSLQGAGDLIGRIIFGYLADFTFTSKRNFYTIGGVMSGLATVIMLHVNAHFITLCILSFLFGVGAGNVFGLLPVLIADGLSPALLQSGFSTLTVFMGAPYLYAPAIGGKWTSFWGSSFDYSLWISISAYMVIPIHYL